MIRYLLSDNDMKLHLSATVELTADEIHRSNGSKGHNNRAQEGRGGCHVNSCRFSGPISSLKAVVTVVTVVDFFKYGYLMIFGCHFAKLHHIFTDFLKTLLNICL